MQHNEFAIELENLTHRFANGVKGVDNVSLSICKGEFVIMAGPNGSGKTTLLRHLNGLVMPSEGIVRVNGVLVKENLLRTRRMVGMVFQDADSQIVGETVREDVAFGPENLGLDPSAVDRQTHWALSKVGLLPMAETSPHLLSGVKNAGWPLPVSCPCNRTSSFLTSPFQIWTIPESARLWTR